MRGYAAIGLDRPNNKENVGGVLRAAQCYGAAMVLIEGGTVPVASTDTTRAYKHIPCLSVESLLHSIPFKATPVIIEIVPGARNLISFIHPESAFYIFGPEGGSVCKELIQAIPLKVQIPTHYCMNLAATVNVVLYDRLSKAGK